MISTNKIPLRKKNPVVQGLNAFNVQYFSIIIAPFALFVFCCGVVIASFTHIFQGYFTGTEISIEFFLASDTMVNNMDKLLI